MLGYHIEVSARHADRLMAPDSGFTHRQTLAGVVRFNSPELHEEASRVVEAGAHALAAEAAHAEELTALAVTAAPQITATAEAIARIDVAASHAHRAAEGGWTAPQLTDEPCLEIDAGRHPVVESALKDTGERFIANDLSMGPSDRLWLITGPNMGGKSTFLRQTALIAVLAQAGAFVPAARAKVGIVDRLFSRVGASDNLARGRSTFMVEMVETAAILAQATKQSLVILDEIGRGTSTYDGLAIAWAVVEAMHDDVQCRTLFATHYHELTRLAGRLDALSLHHVRAREWKGDLVLLHEVADGAADRSYGIAVAKLAGLPPAVVARAKSVLAKLEAGRDATGGIAAGLDDLPLFAATAEAEHAPDPIAAALDEIDPDSLTPREALEQLYRLKRLVAEQEHMSFLDVENRRAIIDRRALADRIGGLRASKKVTAETAAILRGALEYGRAEIARRLTEAPGNGRAAAQATAFLHDQLVRLAYDFVVERVLDQPLSGELALVGLGGTGRGEMAPFSDLDLMFLTAKAPTADVERASEAILHLLVGLETQGRPFGPLGAPS